MLKVSHPLKLSLFNDCIDVINEKESLHNFTDLSVLQIYQNYNTKRMTAEFASSVKKITDEIMKRSEHLIPTFTVSAVESFTNLQKMMILPKYFNT